MNAYPDGNPKTAQGAKKVPLHLVPPSAIHYLAEAFKDGAEKYGPYNWRQQAVSASVYFAAMKRHEDAWWDGEDVSADALVHHLGHVMACCAIILDAASVGMLNDDRPPKGAAAKLQAAYAEGAPLARGAREEAAVEWVLGGAGGPICAGMPQGSLIGGYIDPEVIGPCRYDGKHLPEMEGGYTYTHHLARSPAYDAHPSVCAGNPPRTDTGD